MTGDLDELGISGGANEPLDKHIRWNVAIVPLSFRNSVWLREPFRNPLIDLSAIHRRVVDENISPASVVGLDDNARLEQRVRDLLSGDAPIQIISDMARSGHLILMNCLTTTCQSQVDTSDCDRISCATEIFHSLFAGSKH